MADSPSRRSTLFPGFPSVGRVLGDTLGYSLRWLVVAVVAGVVIGPLVGLFEDALTLSEEGLFKLWYLGLPIVGGLLVGLLIRAEPRVGGNGTQVYIENFERRGRLPGVLAIRKLMGSLLSLGSGGSGGKAGPVILIGGSVGSVLSRWFRVEEREGCDLGALVGAGAAMGALFGMPLSGGLIAAEVVYPASIHYRGLFATLIASCVGATARELLIGPPHIRAAVTAFRVMCGDELSAGWPDVLQWVVAALVASVVSLAFIVLYWWAERLFRTRLRVSVLRPALGGAVCVAVGLLSTVVLPVGSPSVRVLGTGEALLKFALNGEGAVLMVVVLLVAKSLASAATVGSGGSGGLVLPALILGSLSGALVSASTLALGWTPAVVLPVVGLTATLGAVLNVPIAAVVLAVELFGTSVTVPAVVGTVLGFVIGRPWVVYQYRREDDANRVLPGDGGPVPEA